MISQRLDAIGIVLCEFCDEKAVYRNCKFWPASYDDCVSGPLELCEEHFQLNAELYGSTGDEEPINTMQHVLED